MAGMFGNQRTLGISPSQTMGAAPAYGPMMPGGGQPGLFSANPMMAFAGSMNNMNSLQHMGDQAFMGNQAGQDRDLQKMLQQRELANRIGLANIDQSTQFGVQDRRNSGALDQINASGGWERSITGDKLSSAERLAAAQRALDEVAMRGGWEQQGLDRGSREKLGFAELENALRRQEMVNRGAIDQINTQGDVSSNLLGQEGFNRLALERLSGENALNQTRAQGLNARAVQQLQNAGNLDVTGLGELGANYRAGLGATTQQSIAERQINANRQLAEMQDATSRYSVDKQAGAQAELASGDRNFRASEAEKQRQFVAAQTAAERLAQSGPPEHQAKLREYALTKASHEAAMADANAQKAKAESLFATDPRTANLLHREAEAKAAAAETGLERAKKELAQVGLNEREVEARIKRLDAETENLKNPGREKVQTVQGLMELMKQNPALNLTTEDFNVDRTKFPDPATSLTPQVSQKITESVTQGSTLDDLTRQYPNIPVDQLKLLLQGRGGTGFRWGGMVEPFFQNAPANMDYSPAYGSFQY